MRLIKSFTSLLMKLGKKYLLSLIFWNKIDIWSSSKGSYPTTMAYRIIPIDQMSTSGPPYDRPVITSGAA